MVCDSLTGTRSPRLALLVTDQWQCCPCRQSVMELLNRPVDNKPVGVMVPIPQYPLYSATVAEFGMHQVSERRRVRS